MFETTLRFCDSAGKAHPSNSPPSMAMKIQWVREMLRRNRVMLFGASADPGPGNKGGGRDRLYSGAAVEVPVLFVPRWGLAKDAVRERFAEWFVRP
jgi:hypothetical protein